ncbi:hypothetical protein MKZ38_006942 [Zalerion maritima]|uniref:Uncharacterized protein n=1 Tax=Zalerion maritima TaxID=339359 RepID=A0AAD5RVB5_9PEZI|nr:hypothetical protein MKZ38_006942 [Zalerion maritima]
MSRIRRESPQGRLHHHPTGSPFFYSSSSGTPPYGPPHREGDTPEAFYRSGLLRAPVFPSPSTPSSSSLSPIARIQAQERHGLEYVTPANEPLPRRFPMPDLDDALDELNLADLSNSSPEHSSSPDRWRPRRQSDPSPIRTNSSGDLTPGSRRRLRSLNLSSSTSSDLISSGPDGSPNSSVSAAEGPLGRGSQQFHSVIIVDGSRTHHTETPEDNEYIRNRHQPDQPTHQNESRSQHSPAERVPLNPRVENEQLLGSPLVPVPIAPSPHQNAQAILAYIPRHDVTYSSLSEKLIHHPHMAGMHLLSYRNPHGHYMHMPAASELKLMSYFCPLRRLLPEESPGTADSVMLNARLWACSTQNHNLIPRDLRWVVMMVFEVSCRALRIGWTGGGPPRGYTGPHAPSHPKDSHVGHDEGKVGGGRGRLQSYRTALGHETRETERWSLRSVLHELYDVFTNLCEVYQLWHIAVPDVDWLSRGWDLVDRPTREFTGNDPWAKENRARCSRLLARLART